MKPRFGENPWVEEDILITIRAYPTPSGKYTEVSCVAGVNLDGDLRRLHPVPDRLLSYSKRFSKYDVVRLPIKKSSDPRPESYYVNLTAGDFAIVDHIDTKNMWALRDKMVEPFRAPSIEYLQEEMRSRGPKEAHSLALIRPRLVKSFKIKAKTKTEWDQDEKFKLTNKTLFDVPTNTLEFIPYNFMYHFFCEDDRCTGHHFSAVDWEVAQAYRRWTKDYPDDWEDKLYEKFAVELVNKDLQFYVGTQRKRTNVWSIVGLYYPPKKQTALEMFDFKFALSD